MVLLNGTIEVSMCVIIYLIMTYPVEQHTIFKPQSRETPEAKHELFLYLFVSFWVNEFRHQMNNEEFDGISIFSLFLSYFQMHSKYE